MQGPGKIAAALLAMTLYLIVSAYVLLTFRPSPVLFFTTFCFIFLGGVFLRAWISVMAKD